MIEQVTLEKILKHTIAGRIDPTSYDFRSQVNLEKIIMDNKNYLNTMNQEAIDQLFFLLIKEGKYGIFKMQEFSFIFNDFYDRFAKGSIEREERLISEVLSAVIHSNNNDLKYVIKWIGDILMRTSKMTYEDNKMRRIYSVFSTVDLSDFNLTNTSFVWDLPFEKWMELIESNMLNLEKENLAFKLAENYLKTNISELEKLDAEKQIILSQKFKNVFSDKILLSFFEKELLEIKESLPSEEAYEKLKKMFDLMASKSHSMNSKFKESFRQVGIDKKYFNKKYYNKKTGGEISNVLQVLMTEDMIDIFIEFEIPFCCYYNLDLEKIPKKQRKKALFDMLDIDLESPENIIKEALYSDKDFGDILNVDVKLPEDIRYKLLAEFPESVDYSLYTTLRKCSGKKLNLISSYIYYAEDDLSLSDDGFEMLKLIYKK